MKKSNNQSNQTTNKDLLGGGGVKTREQEAREPDRPPRIAMTAGMNLHVDESLLDRKNFYYRFFAESAAKGGRISSAKGAYYDHVTDKEGNNITRPGGGGDTMYLMKLPMKYRLDDLNLKEKKNAATMDAEYQLKSNEYAPKGTGVNSKVSSTPT